MKMNVWFVKTSQFLQQFHLLVQYKPRKEHIILNALNRLANNNGAGHNLEYSKLDALFVYHTTLVEINPGLV